MQVCVKVVGRRSGFRPRLLAEATDGNKRVKSALIR